MANGNSDIAAAKLTGGSLYGTVNGSKREQEPRYASYLITLLGNEANGAYHTLDPKLPADQIRVIPEECRLRKVSGTFSMTTLLQAVAADGTTLTALSTTSAAYTGAAVLTLAPADANVLPVLGKTDGLRINFPTVTTTNAGASFEVCIAYREYH